MGVQPCRRQHLSQLHGCLGPYRDVIVDAKLPFPVIKSLVSASDQVRQAALHQIQSGTFTDTHSVATIKRDFADKARDPEVERVRRRETTLRKAAEAKARQMLDAFGADFEPFAQMLVDFYCADGIDEATFRATRSSLMEQAPRWRRRFEEIFDVNALPPYWEYNFGQHPREIVRLAKSYDALTRICEGEFQVIEPETGNPFDTSHDYLDYQLVESIIWLADDSALPSEQLPRQPAVSTVVKQIAPTRRLTSVEICAGAGGQALGLHAAGFDAWALYEQNPNAIATLQANYPLGSTHCEDVRRVDFSKFKGKVDLLAGGVPCQPHSSMGRRLGRLDERDLFLEAVRAVDEARPRAFFFENVKGFTFRANATYRAELHQKFEALGYQSQIFSFYGSDYGLAQGRPRVGFIGFRDGLMTKFRMPPILSEKPRTVGEVLLDLVKENGWKHADWWAAQKANMIGPTIVGGSEQSGTLAFSSNLRVGKWEEMNIDPAGVAASAPSRDYPKNKPFQLTLAMIARLQGFPDGWKFVGLSSGEGQRQKQMTRQIANALPPVMARAVGLAINSALTGMEFDYDDALKQPLFTDRLNLGVLRSLADDEALMNPEWAIADPEDADMEPAEA